MCMLFFYFFFAEQIDHIFVFTEDDYRYVILVYDQM